MIDVPYPKKTLTIYSNRIVFLLELFIIDVNIVGHLLF